MTRPDTRHDRRSSRAETTLAVTLSSLALVITALAFSQINVDSMARRTLDTAQMTGPVAQAQWQDTLRFAFDDLSRMPATLPSRGDVGFNLNSQPEPSMLAQPDVPPGRFM
ncbi:hypothetical protein [Blastochloris viridis]|uniref:Uncharacterized protein n=1 Tax=Blastochloris viridis TaxID=1079 RepID=A0A0H5B9I3_BLAVI|nr:hypothetical protein [Blastochloris viridis]ALK08910.1 hypothetical protein BVIR_1121 [Blastochloris viridis]BAR97694.1 hypothetical protein BV133_101 [Blastochloris viridis]CUU41571.1 hypothetical protein BVIRIDIS_05640 [Blastochloris viridis]